MEEPVTIASAVVLPSQELSPRSKRRQLAPSASPEAASKRLRLDDDTGDGIPSLDRRESIGSVGVDAVVATKPAEDEPPTPVRRRRLGADEEKKRGRRLFGGILGTLGKFEKDSRTQKARSSEVKRKEVEAKLQEKLKQQTEELDERRRRESDNANLKRKIEQRDFEERSMEIRHANRRAEANMLSTRAQPKLFYLPWKLLPTDEEAIRTQKENIEEIITNEELEFQRRREEDEEQLKALGDVANVYNEEPAIPEEAMPRSPSLRDEHMEGSGDKGDGDPDGAEAIHPDHDEPEADGNANNDHVSPEEHSSDARRHSDIGDPVDIIEEGGEDTVIY